MGMRNNRERLSLTSGVQLYMALGNRLPYYRNGMGSNVAESLIVNLFLIYQGDIGEEGPRGTRGPKGPRVSTVI